MSRIVLLAEPYLKKLIDARGNKQEVKDLIDNLTVEQITALVDIFGNLFQLLEYKQASEYYLNNVFRDLIPTRVYTSKFKIVFRNNPDLILNALKDCQHVFQWAKDNFPDETS
jgi:hypothetical protein